MNATVAVPRSYTDTAPAVDSRSAFGGVLVTAARRAVGQRRAVWLVAAVPLVLAAVVVGVAEVPILTAYATVFALSVATNAVLFLPSARGAVMIAAAITLNPMAVAIAAGAGGAVGELTGYALGRSSRRVIKGVALPGWLSRHAEKRMGLTLLALYLVPSPFMDAAGIVAGRMGYPALRFLAYAVVGKIIQSIIFVYLVIWNISLISPLVG